MNNLFHNTIRVANANPELRPLLLPLLKEAALNWGKGRLKRTPAGPYPVFKSGDWEVHSKGPGLVEVYHKGKVVADGLKDGKAGKAKAEELAGNTSKKAGYEEIKRQLSEAARLVDEGKVGEADTLIRSIRGLTGADLRSNLTPAQMKKLREFVKKPKPKKKGKVKTYAQAKEIIIDALESQGWDIHNRRGKVPRATKGREAVLHFKPQAIYFNANGSNKLNDARSAHENMKKLAEMDPRQLDAWAMKLMADHRDHWEDFGRRASSLPAAAKAQAAKLGEAAYKAEKKAPAQDKELRKLIGQHDGHALELMDAWQKTFNQAHEKWFAAWKAKNKMASFADQPLRMRYDYNEPAPQRLRNALVTQFLVDQADSRRKGYPIPDHEV